MTIHHALAAFAITVAGLAAIAVLAQQEWTRQRREAAQRASAARRAGPRHVRVLPPRDAA